MKCLLCEAKAVADCLCVLCGAKEWAAELWWRAPEAALELLVAVEQGKAMAPLGSERHNAIRFVHNLDIAEALLVTLRHRREEWRRREREAIALEALAEARRA